jgi:hypothetical protein
MLPSRSRQTSQARNFRLANVRFQRREEHVRSASAALCVFGQSLTRDLVALHRVVVVEESLSERERVSDSFGPVRDRHIQIIDPIAPLVNIFFKKRSLLGRLSKLPAIFARVFFFVAYEVEFMLGASNRNVPEPRLFSAATVRVSENDAPVALESLRPVR